MLEGEEHQTLDMIISLLVGFIDDEIGLAIQAPWVRMHTIYFDLVGSLKGYETGEMTSDIWTEGWERHMRKIKSRLERYLMRVVGMGCIRKALIYCPIWSMT